MTLEDLGFCAKGEGGAFVSDGRLGPGGALPTNTNGGGPSYTPPGMYRPCILVEAVRQLPGGGGDRQVPGAHGPLANGCGGVTSRTPPPRLERTSAVWGRGGLIRLMSRCPPNHK